MVDTLLKIFWEMFLSMEEICYFQLLEVVGTVFSFCRLFENKYGIVRLEYDRKTELYPANSYEQDVFKETLLQMYTYTGTHMDPPAHIFAGRTTFDEFPPEQFIGKALVIDCCELRECEVISMEHIHQAGENVKKADFLLFHLCWDKRWGMDAYFGDYPCMDEEVLNFILSGNYKGIGFDVIGIDPIIDVNLTRHKKLFRNCDMVNIENLKNLDLCGTDLFWFSCFPLKIENSDGSPVRAVAWFE